MDSWFEVDKKRVDSKGKDYERERRLKLLT